MENKEQSKEEFVEWARSFTKEFSLRSINLFQQLPTTKAARILGKQFLHSATPVGANYRAATRGRPKVEYFSKWSICVEDADEVLYWLELIEEAGTFPSENWSR